MENNYEKISLRENLKIILWIINNVRKLLPVLFWIHFIVRIIQYLKSPIELYIGAVFIDTVINKIINGTITVDIIIEYLIIYTLVEVFFGSIIVIVNDNLDKYIQSIRIYKINLLFAEKVQSLGIESSEDPSFENLKKKLKEKSHLLIMCLT